MVFGVIKLTVSAEFEKKKFTLIELCKNSIIKSPNTVIMPYTTIDQLTKNEQGGIKKGAGSKHLGTLYYGEDILKVTQQLDAGPLEEVDVLFERNDGENQGIHEITVLAAKKMSDLSLYCDIVALPWPSYYEQKEHGGTADFPGSIAYQPGRFLPKI